MPLPVPLLPEMIESHGALAAVASRPTSAISSTQVAADISAADIAQVGSSVVTVTNPGRGTSNALTFTKTTRASSADPLFPAPCQHGQPQPRHLRIDRWRDRHELERRFPGRCL